MIKEIAQTVGRVYADVRYGVLPPTTAVFHRETTPSDLAIIRNTLLEHPQLSSVITRRFSRLKEGALIEITQPSPEVEDLIRFFAPPPPYLYFEGKSPAKLFLEYWQDRQKTDLPPPINDTFPFASQTQEFLARMWVDFASFQMQPDGDLPIQSTFPQESKRQEMWLRFSQNYKWATRAILAGFGTDIRRTGEGKALHSLRTHERVKSDPISEIMQNNWIVYTALLASILHDAPEDLENFRITKSEKPQEYLIQFTKNRKDMAFPLLLSTQEFTLLQMQLDALTTPKELDTQPEEQKTQEQFRHLKRMIRKIHIKFKQDGVLASYVTLLIKFADRVDNLCTYYVPKEGSDIVIDLRAKLHESVRFFKDLENLAKKFRKELVSNKSEKIFHFSDSVINFCRYLLLGGNYQELFGNELRRFREMREKLDENTQAIIDKNFLIPMIFPAGKLKPGLIYKIPEE